MEAADKPVRVLVVEDSAEIRLALELGLAQEGCEIITADGLDGLKKATEINPDIVLLDLRMPGMNGTDLCREIRKISDVPVIIYSGEDGADEVKAAIDAGATDFVLKSSGLLILIDRFNKHLLNRKTSRPGNRRVTIITPVDSRQLYALVLDPEPRTANVFAEEIVRLGHRAEAPGAMRKPDTGGQRPDVIILDYAMPKRSGIDLAEDLMSMPSERPLGLIISARSNPPDLRRRLSKCLLLDFIQKPWEPSHIPHRIASALETYLQRTRIAG